MSVCSAWPFSPDCARRHIIFKAVLCTSQRLDSPSPYIQGTEKAFVQRCRESFGKHANYVPDRGDALVFSIRHYAGDVS